MKIVFFGTPDYVIPVLDGLHKEFKTITGNSPIEAVITQTPKPTGRKKILSYSAVDTWAHSKKVPKYFDPLDVVRNKIKADLGMLASYGEIIPDKVISHFPHGILNIHPSILPDWRGSSPVQATIISGSTAGATIIKIDEKLDHGPIVSQFKDEVLPEDTSKSLRERLFKRSAEVLISLIPAYLTGKIKPREQDHEIATFTKQIKKEDAFILPEYLNHALLGKNYKKSVWEIPFMKDFTYHYSPLTIHRFIRAMQPWPGAWTKVRIKNQELRIKILESHLDKLVPTASCLVPDLVQLEGKTPVSWEQFKAGYPKISFE